MEWCKHCCWGEWMPSDTDRQYFTMYNRGCRYCGPPPLPDHYELFPELHTISEQIQERDLEGKK